jgi:hypothetical protein
MCWLTCRLAIYDNFDFYIGYTFFAPLVGSSIGIGPPGEFSNLAVSTSTPVSVTSKVCSISPKVSIQKFEMDHKALNAPNCAVRLPSIVTFVQSSGQRTS